MDFLAERMTRQGLAARSTAMTAGVAAAAVGLQAQDPGAARLGVRARSDAVDEASVLDALTEVAFDGRRGWALGRVEASPGFRLLPMFDNYLLGYRDRTAMLDVRRQDRVYVGGIIKATVVCDGRVLGIWRLDRSGRSATVRVSPFEPFTRRHQDGLDRERADIERFLGRPVALDVEPG